MLDSIKKRLLTSPKHLILAGVFCLLLVAGLIIIQTARAKDRVLPNVLVGDINLGGLTPDQAKTRLNNALRSVNIAGVQFRYQETALLTVKANEPETSTSSFIGAFYDIDGTVDDAFAFGHNGGVFALLAANTRALFAEVRIPPRLHIEQEGLKELLEKRVGALRDVKKSAKNAAFKISRGGVAIDAASSSASTQGAWEVTVEPDSAGLVIDYDEAFDRMAQILQRWWGGVIDLKASIQPPAIVTAEAEARLEDAKRVLARGAASLAYDDMLWTLSQEEVAKALTLLKTEEGGIALTLKPEVLEPLLDEAAKAIETEPKPTSFTVGEDGRAHDFVGGTIGKIVNREASLARVNEQFSSSENGVFPIIVATTASTESNPVAEELGIREMLGYGTSKFSGSPKNRRINIANGAARLNGLIIKPGEEVSLIEHLKPFDAASGYVQELVIKNNRTVPEYGGGLCQIGTTTFRAVMGAGLPITARQNHAYRVVYYEPAGTDATLYDPAPDFKFVNDTNSHAVLVTKIDGDYARFELWGTRDGRVQNQSKVKMWNVTAPPEPKMIETSALPEGQKKCFESPHAGATTEFTYSITYPDGTVKAQNFHSVYKPWQQQCLIGKAGAPDISLGKDGSIKELPPTPSATTTPETI